MSDLEPHDEAEAVQKMLTGGTPTYYYSAACMIVCAIITYALVWVDAMQTAMVVGLLNVCIMLHYIHITLVRIKNRRIRIWEARQRYGED